MSQSREINQCTKNFSIIVLKEGNGQGKAFSMSELCHEEHTAQSPMWRVSALPKWNKTSQDNPLSKGGVTEKPQ